MHDVKRQDNPFVHEKSPSLVLNPVIPLEMTNWRGSLCIVCPLFCQPEKFVYTLAEMCRKPQG